MNRIKWLVEDRDLPAKRGVVIEGALHAHRGGVVHRGEVIEVSDEDAVSLVDQGVAAYHGNKAKHAAKVVEKRKAKAIRTGKPFATRERPAGKVVPEATPAAVPQPKP